MPDELETTTPPVDGEGVVAPVAEAATPPNGDGAQTPSGDGAKRATLANMLEATLHREFTIRADDLFAGGRVTRDEYIALSNAIGLALDAFHERLQQPDMDDLRTRAPYDDAPSEVAVAGREATAPTEDPLAAVKIGARNSKVDLARIQGMHDLANDLGAKCGMMGRRGMMGEDDNEEPAGDYPPGDGKEAPPVEPEAPAVPTVNWQDATKTAPWAVKALGGGRIGGYAVLWGDPQRKDLTKEYFTPDTADLTAIFKQLGRLPNLYAHGGDGSVRSAIIGVIDTMIPDDIGLWYEAQLERASAYREAVLRLIERGLLGSSSGTLPAAREVAPDGHIKRWPIVEVSLTPAPAEYRMLDRPVSEIKDLYEAIGLNFEGEETPAASPVEETPPVESDKSADQAVAASHDPVAVEFELLALLEV